MVHCTVMLGNRCAGEGTHQSALSFTPSLVSWDKKSGVRERQCVREAAVREAVVRQALVRQAVVRERRLEYQRLCKLSYILTSFISLFAVTKQ
jgi:hypothetical protein